LVQYERERTGAAAQLRMRASALDAAVKAARPTDAKGQGRTFELPSVEPWPHSVNGAELLDAISEAIGTYIIMPAESMCATALWVLHTYLIACFVISPRLAVTSPEKGCGKTTLLDILSRLVRRALSAANVTPAAIFRVVETHQPTLLIDEADTFLANNDELRGILNSGHRRGGSVIRTIGDDHEPRQFSTWAPAAIAMIGRLPDTLNDRSIVISLRRRKATERVRSFRSDRAEYLTVLARKMARWAQDHSNELVDADPDMNGLENRTADNWRPLFAIADAAGGRWPEHARMIASAVVQAAVDQSISAQLFADIRWVFDGCPGAEDAAAAVDRVPSAFLVERLVKIEGRPWAEWKGGKPIT
jgi:putative DNA primase/helicase